MNKGPTYKDISDLMEANHKRSVYEKGCGRPFSGFILDVSKNGVYFCRPNYIDGK
jgi:hypothetical protein